MDILMLKQVKAFLKIGISKMGKDVDNMLTSLKLAQPLKISHISSDDYICLRLALVPETSTLL